MRRKWHLLEIASLAVAIGLSMPGASGMREDELLCEEALARLDECCTAEDLANVSCVFHQGCMGDDPSPPELSPSDSRCIREASCEELFFRGVCAGLRDNQPSSELQVCP